MRIARFITVGSSLIARIDPSTSFLAVRGRACAGISVERCHILAGGAGRGDLVGRLREH
jgi:hypothetical protein